MDNEIPVESTDAIGVAAHEGQLFGLANQLLGLFTAAGLITLCLSSIVLWWRRRASGVLGAPSRTRKARSSVVLVVLVAAIGIYLPMMGLSLIALLLVERAVLRRIPKALRWLGLEPVV